jgi:hypothetical protein
MGESNGYVRLSLFIWIIGVIISILLFIGSNVIANENRSIVRDEDLKNCLHGYIIPMKESIARIEVRLGTNLK